MSQSPKEEIQQFSIFAEDPRIVKALGSHRQCALPNLEYFSERYDLTRATQIKDIYTEYVDACNKCYERAYSKYTFAHSFSARHKEFCHKSKPEWYPGELVRTFWSKRKVAGKWIYLYVAQFAWSEYAYIKRMPNMSVKSWIEATEALFKTTYRIPKIVEYSAHGIGKCGYDKMVDFSYHYKFVLYGAHPKTKKTAARMNKSQDYKNNCSALRSVWQRLENNKESLTDDLIDLVVDEALGRFNAGIPFNDGQSRERMFKEKEREAMYKLPNESWKRCEWYTRKVYSDYHVIVKGSIRASVPFECINDWVRVCLCDSDIDIYKDGVLIAKHSLDDIDSRGWITDDAHRHPRHKFFAHRLEKRFLDTARKHGFATLWVMRELVARARHTNDWRDCRRLLMLADIPSENSLEDACVIARQIEEAINIETIKLAMKEIAS